MGSACTAESQPSCEKKKKKKKKKKKIGPTPDPGPHNPGAGRRIQPALCTSAPPIIWLPCTKSSLPGSLQLPAGQRDRVYPGGGGELCSGDQGCLSDGHGDSLHTWRGGEVHHSVHTGVHHSRETGLHHHHHSGVQGGSYYHH